ncbi:hypothetical protein BCR32DRAFT_270838 [Anaeromyces robustus]|uniref:VanZ-like domain-containing protein n=1 Tax=Anaeromyces robustus TaxID=1754192 RepID=A0A1Y1WUD9_9FUNG|nr:hypothetical protein BCR32DRAFT_270838 [Anaeromyces robustus]|eukprot:ORX77157.1 hypothetical protein BCR32DRAFT_270838 [Anaeromyces robustus]
MKIRCSVVILTIILLIYFAYLGFAPNDWIKLPNFLKNNDGVLHFIIFFITTILLNYLLIFSRTFLYWTACFILMLLWSVISEVIQSLFPYRDFDAKDIIANLLGTTTSSLLILIIRIIKYKIKNKKTEPNTEKDNILLV